MTIWYIGPSGNDTTGNGTAGTPYATVGKCLTVGADGDTIKALTGTYTIGSTTNVNKQVTITSNSGVKTDVIFNASTTIFNIQSNNVVINYVTLQTSDVTELVTIDRISTGTTVPTFWTGINISNCNIKYVTNGLSLNGSFTINSNTFSRMSGTNIASIIKVYSTRGTCSISSNTFTDASPVQYVIYLTSTGSGTYLDRCNSKGGTLTVASNIVTFTHVSQSSYFIFCDYFNQFTFVTSPDSQYNPNTRISLNINNNNMSLESYGKFIYIDSKSNSDYNTFGTCSINTNTVNNTDYGAIHLGKNTTNHNALTISSTDLNRSIFKIYSNTLNTVPPPTSIVWFDASAPNVLFQDVAGTIPAINVDDPVRCWKSVAGSGISATTATAVRINTYTTGNKCVDLMNSGGSSFNTWLDYTKNYSIIPNASYIVVFTLGSTITNSPFNAVISFYDQVAWQPQTSTTIIMEAFYTPGASAQRSYTYNTKITAGTPIIYGVIANSSTGQTKCYILHNNTTMTLIGTLTYTTSYMNPGSNVFSIGKSYLGSWNNFKIAELKVYDSALSEGQLGADMSAMKTKWNIT